MKASRFLASFLALFVLVGSIATAIASFPDIKSPVLQEAVEYLNDKGIISGYPDGTFRPDQVINRAEALKIIFESRGIAVENDTNSGFPDVDAKLWFAKYVTSAKRQGLIKGYPDGSYKPTQEVNKAEFIKIAMLAQTHYQTSSDYSPATSRYKDLDTGAWYMPFVSYGARKDFLDKTTRLNPTAGMTRGEAALIIYRLAKFNEAQSAQAEADKAEAIEKSAVKTCETCVHGDDISQYEWFESEYVEVKDGKLFLGDRDVTEDLQTGWMSYDLMAERVATYEERDALANLDLSIKLNVDKEYPELYARAIGIHGGYQWEDEYSSSPDGETIVPLNKDGIDLDDCDCNFEGQLLSRYAAQPDDMKEPFEDWIGTVAAKPFIYDVIYWYNKKPDYRP